MADKKLLEYILQVEKKYGLYSPVFNDEEMKRLREIVREHVEAMDKVEY